MEDQFPIVRSYDGNKIIYHSIYEGFQELQFSITDESWEVKKMQIKIQLFLKFNNSNLTKNLNQIFFALIIFRTLLMARSFRCLIFIRFIRN
ncbi:unnamed protein product [Paramecium sonneborni]|uniref:Uncharacterized protein n=1 Tax=Paramecium sonneborni TaxID=65129 RepID=A0A8S1RPF5_9CILI|nr:unnamed protein product [Paramecium sonneborni]